MADNNPIELLVSEYTKTQNNIIMDIYNGKYMPHVKYNPLYAIAKLRNNILEHLYNNDEEQLTKDIQEIVNNKLENIEDMAIHYYEVFDDIKINYTLESILLSVFASLINAYIFKTYVKGTELEKFINTTYKYVPSFIKLTNELQTEYSHYDDIIAYKISYTINTPKDMYAYQWASFLENFNENDYTFNSTNYNIPDCILEIKKWKHNHNLLISNIRKLIHTLNILPYYNKN